MLLLRRISILVSIFTSALIASSITIEGPFGATDGSVIGDHSKFDIESATLTQPTTTGGDWTVTIDTNYGTALPGSPDVVPDFTDFGVTLAAADFLISWNGGDYAVVLNAHGGYGAGNLYQGSGFLTAQQVLGLSTSQYIYHSTDDVWLAGGGTLQGAGTVSAAPLGDGTTEAEYAITDTFAAPAGFLASGDFTIQMSSADCANGYMTGTGNFGGGTSGGGQLPEPATALLVAPAAVWLLWRRRTVA